MVLLTIMSKVFCQSMLRDIWVGIWAIYKEIYGLLIPLGKASTVLTGHLITG